MAAFVLAIFLSAFLLFQVQPIIARHILPWYGGSPAVWTTCMLFFQLGLLAGYGWAHLLVSWLRERPRVQAAVHLALVALAATLLPITPAETLKPDGTEPSPAAGIVVLLLATVGLPYLVISASGPLLQHWFGAVARGRSPYRLYAVSNFGSLLGLLSYPLWFEPRLRLAGQAAFWSAGFAAYGLLAAACAWLFVSRSRRAGTAAESTAGMPACAPARPGALDRWMWVALAACGSTLLLAMTNRICQDVAVVPFLWVLPLGLYLVTFIIAFDHARWYYRPLWLPAAALAFAALVHLLNRDFAESEIHISIQLAICCAALLAGCMVCHGEMVRLKPDPHYLTGFYLSVALGGALGGIFVGVVAPRIFSGFWELHVGLVATGCLAGFCLLRDLRRSGRGRAAVTTLGLGWVAALAAMTVFLSKHISATSGGAIETARSFYGVLRVYDDYAGTEDHLRSLYHGRISHGHQYLAETWRRWPATYYTEGSGPGVVFEHHRLRRGPGPGGPLSYGVVGLGVGTLASYARPGDTVRFYEINEQVEDLARRWFTYLADCRGEVTVVPGDARISLERELAAGRRSQFDVLFVDAFSGDSIPVHLLTREAFEIYFRQLRPGGVLCVHITNLHLDLGDPVRVLARELGHDAALVEHEPFDDSEYYSAWVLVTDDRDWLDSLRAADLVTPWRRPSPREIRWTDDYSNLLQVVEW